jgi:hypothetical protein
MKNPESNIIKQLSFYNYTSDILRFSKIEKHHTKDIIIEMLKEREGKIYYSTRALTFEETIIDVFFLEKNELISEYLFTKKLYMYNFIPGSLNKIVTYEKDVFN